jgi:predicted HTH domain antitoxin
MLVSMEVPDQVAHSLRLDEPQGIRRALEAVAVQGYKAGELSRGQVSEMLGLEFDETEKLLKDNGALLQLSADEVREQSEYLRQLLSR